MAQELEPHILRKYDVLQRLGKGAYGIVYKAVDKRTQELIAIKKVFDAFHNATDAQRTYRQVVFLQGLGKHQNVVGLHGTIRAQNNKDLYLVFDFMETDLHAVIRAGILQDVHRRWVIYQTLRALLYIHSGDIIHRDLKPSNLLLDQECNLKVADFGLARSLASEYNQTDPVLTEYVATRWYRAPQILLGSTRYSKAVDMWSVGCILGELLLGKPIFQGNSTLNQVEKIMELLGPPRSDDISSMESQYASKIMASINPAKRKTFNSFFATAPQEALDLLRKLLVYNPAQRLTAQQALSHAYLSDFRNLKSQILLRDPVRIQINDNKKLTIKEYREALYCQIVRGRKDKQDKTKEKSKQNLFQDRSKAQRYSRERDRDRQRERLKQIQRQLQKQKNKILKGTSNYFSKKEEPIRRQKRTTSNPGVKPMTATTATRPTPTPIDGSILASYQSVQPKSTAAASQVRATSQTRKRDFR